MNPDKQSCQVSSGNSDNIRHNVNENIEVITHIQEWKRTTI